MVDAVRPGGAPVSTQARRAAEGGTSGFVLPESSGAARASGTSASTPASGLALGLESMLLLQAVDDAPERNRSARKRGMAMIAALSDLQRALLAEDDPALALRALSELAAGGPEAADPDLASVMRAIILRSRVEVARRIRDAR